MTAPLEVTDSAAGAPPEAALAGLGDKAIQGRSLGQIAWMRLKRDKVAVAGGVFIVLLILIAISALLVDRVLGLIQPNEFHQDLINQETLSPTGTFGGMSWSHPLGVEPVNGRDILTRIYAGSWISLLIAVSATLLSVTIGTVMGVVAG
ncbi:MAG TPA: ABC transporter permease, partial [Actinophytocola sp.]